MGGLAPVSAHAQHSARPPMDVSGNFLRRTCLHSNLKTSPPTPKKTYAKFQNPKINFGDYHPPTMAQCRGQGGSQNLWGVLNLNIFVTQGNMQSFRIIRQILAITPPFSKFQNPKTTFGNFWITPTHTQKQSPLLAYGPTQKNYIG